MNTRRGLTVFCGALILSILIGTGIFFYAQWDWNHFQSSLRKLPELGTSGETSSPRGIITTAPSKPPTTAVIVAPERLENQISPPSMSEMAAEEPLLAEADVSTLDSELEESSLSEIELPDLVSEEPVEAVDYTLSEYDISSPTDLLRSEYGDSEDVDVIAEVLGRSETGTVTTNDVINMAEALLRIIPEDHSENRRSVMNLLASLSEIRKHEFETGVTTEEVSITYSVTE